MHARRVLAPAFVCLVAVCLLGPAAAVPVKAQGSPPAPAPESVGSSAASLERVIGDVTATNPAAKQLGLKMDTGGTITVVLQTGTVYLRVPPGETDLRKAVEIAPAEIGVGDRVLARGRRAEDQKSIAAVTVIVMTKADLARTREQERAERQKRTVAGTISALNQDTKEITLSVRAREGTTTLIVQSSEQAVFRRYAADSVQLAQAKPSSFVELKVGDSLRVLGDKNSAGTRVKPEEIISGSFRNIAGIVTAIDAAGGEIRITDLQSRRPLTVRITSETMVRRMPPTKPAATANRPPEGGRGTASAGPPSPGPARGAPTAAATNRPPDGGGTPAPGGRTGAGPAQGASGGGGQMDLERMPVLKVGDLKRDEPIVVLCTVGAEPSRVTAIVVVAGVEPLLGPALQDQTQIGGAWNFFDVSVP